MTLPADTHNLFEALYKGRNLTSDETRTLFSLVVKGEMSDAHLAALLIALKIKGEQPAEIAGAALALHDNAEPFPRPDYRFADIVGTGGDGHNTINISSAAAVVAASCGLPVAKHGNRSVSSKSGSAELFREFGVNLSMRADVARRCLDQSGFCFLHAPVYHAGIANAMPVRTTLKTRTLFNVLGPLANPAKPTHKMIGVYAPELQRPFAETLNLLGYKNAMVIHGSGLDELALHGTSTIVEVNNGDISEYTVSPADFGVKEAPLSALVGGEPAYNRILLENLLKGEGEQAHMDAVAINAGALLKLAGIADCFADGASKALESMASGAPYATIIKSAEISQQDQ